MEFTNNYKGINKGDWYMRKGEDSYYQVISIVIDDNEIDVICRECYSNKKSKGARVAFIFDNFINNFKHERKIKLDKINGKIR